MRSTAKRNTWKSEEEEDLLSQQVIKLPSLIEIDLGAKLTKCERREMGSCVQRSWIYALSLLWVSREWYIYY